MKFVVLGGYGIIGSTIVRDLFDSCKNCTIVIAGRDYQKAEEYSKSFNSPRVRAASVDVTNINLTSKLLKNSEVCINAVQYQYNLNVMKACLKAGCNYVDLGGLFHDTLKQLKLNRLFKKAKLTAVLGCGSTPGITNVMAAYGYSLLKKVKEMHISFADWDVTKYNSSFILPYSFQTIADEFTMNPAVLSDGKIKFVKPGSGNKTLFFPRPFGKQNGFYTLHSELATFPESFDLRECSFRVTFSKKFRRQIKKIIAKKLIAEEVKAFGTTNANARIEDAELVRVEIIGKQKLVIDCITYTNKRINLSGGTWHTATPASIIAQFISKKKIKSTGVYPPEKIVPIMDFFKELKKRGSLVYVNGKKVI